MILFRSSSLLRPAQLFWPVAGVFFLLYILNNSIRIDAIKFNIVSIFYILSPYFVSNAFLESIRIGWIILVAFGLGYSLLASIGVRNSHNHALVSLPIGMGILGFCQFPLIFAGLLSPGSVIAILVCFSLLLLVLHGKRIMSREVWQEVITTSRRCWNPFFGVPLLFSGFIAFCCGLMPPTQSDALRYHLTVPWQYLKQGGYVEFPHFSFASFPFLIDYMFLYPFALGSISGPKLLHVVFYGLSTGLAGCIGAKLAGRQAGGWAMLVFASTPFAPIFSSWGFIEFGLTTYTLLTFWLAIEARALRLRGDSGDCWRYTVVCGIACGMMLGCKYTALASMGFAGLILKWPRSFRPPDLVSGWPTAACMGLIAGILGSPWYIKNWLLYENPVYPFGRSLFPTPGWSEFNQLFFSYHAGLKGNLTAVQQMPLVNQFTDWVTLPFRIVLYPGEQWHPVDFGGWPLGPLWLILGTVLVLCVRWNSRRFALGAGALFLFVIWGMTYRDIRFLLPAMAVLAPLLGLVAAGLVRRAPLARWVLLLLVGVNLLQPFALTFLPFNYGPWWVVGGAISEEEYLTEYSVDTRHQNQAFRWLEENTTPDQRVLLHGFETHFYCPNDYIGADWFNTDPLLAWSWEAGSTEDLVQRLHENGIEYIVYDYGNIRQYMNFYRLFRLQPEISLPLLRDLVDHEAERVRYPILYRDFIREHQVELQQAEVRSPHLAWLNELLEGGRLNVVFRYVDERDEQNGIAVLKVPEPGQ